MQRIRFFETATKRFSLIVSKKAQPMSTSTPKTLHPIVLNDKEKQITTTLQDYTKYYNTNIANDKDIKPIELRITGGWVRDKLLGKESHDIDIGIDHISGLEFVTGLKEYLDRQTEDISGTGKITTSLTGIHKIKKNPEKSKHLETCTTHLLGNDIDFVNLRSEKYTEDSRIPTIKAGSPKEDAYRRDATLNSLFFNLRTMQVEDLTGRGLQDLKDGILRTPLEPEKTFLDDPLRCLRMIRFASNFNFIIDKAAMEAMDRKEIRVALDRKISRERIGSEFRKIILGKNPIYGLSLLNTVEFYNIFGFGEKEMGEEKVVKPVNMDERAMNSLISDGIKASLSDIVASLPVIKDFVFDHSGAYNRLKSLFGEPFRNDLSTLAFYCSLILNKWNNETVIQTDDYRSEEKTTGKKRKGKKVKPTSAAHLIVLQGLKMPMKDANLISLIVSGMEEFGIRFRDYKNMSRSEIALKLIIPYGENWRLNLLVYFILRNFKHMELIEDTSNSIEEFLDMCEKLDLEYAYKETVMVNGRELINSLKRKPGPWLRQINGILLEWQLDHPNCTKQQVVEYAQKLDI